MSEKKRIPEIRFEGFQGEWEEVKLGEKMIFSNGINSSKENYGIGRKMISVMDILNKKPIQYKNILNSVNVDQKTEQSNKVEKGDLVFVRSSEVVEEVGYCNEYIDDEYALYSGFSILGKKISEYNTNFFLNSLNYKNRIQIEKKAGGSTRFNVSQKILNEILLFTPSLDEQNRISQIIKLIDSIILNIENRIKSFEEYKQSMLQKMFPKEGEKVPEIRFEGFEGEWEEKELKNILIEREKKMKPSLEFPLVSFTVEKGVTPKTDRYNREFLVRDDEKLYKITHLDDIVYNPANLKFGAISRNKYGDAVFSPIYITFEIKSNYNPIFIEHIMTNNNFINRALHFQEGTVYERMAVKPKDLLSMKVNIPDITEQNIISKYFNILEEKILKERNKLNIYVNLKKTLLGKLFI